MPSSKSLREGMNDTSGATIARSRKAAQPQVR
jgi:hypothetical protein